MSLPKYIEGVKVRYAANPLVVQIHFEEIWIECADNLEINFFAIHLFPIRDTLEEIVFVPYS